MASISDEAGQLLAMATETRAQAGIREAIAQVTSASERACTLAGQGTADAQELFEQGQAAIDVCRSALAGVNLFYDTCGIVAARHM